MGDRSQCRQITGSAFASNLFVSAKACSWIKGAEHVVRYKAPGRDITKAFCRTCGSGLPYVSDDGARVPIPAGALKDDPRIETRYRIFEAERPDWSTDLGSVDAFEAFPE
ncbi:GFA family protein [uncultured Roseibium sp.]|uniref:GFA family protein n=1 Tax=uncultured Roseibium sp. TaxID=1936171 RepID=UPI0032178029